MFVRSASKNKWILDCYPPWGKGKRIRYLLPITFYISLLFLGLSVFSPGCARNTATLSSYTEAHTQIGNDWLAKRQYRHAVVEYKNVLEFDSTYTPALIGLAKVNIEVGKIEEGISLLEFACENDLYAKEPFLVLAELFIKLNSYDEADEVLIEAITYNPNIPEYYITRGIIYERMELLDQSVQQYKKAIDLDSTLGIAYNKLAIVFLRMGFYELSKKSMDMAIKNQFPVNPEIRKNIEENFNKQGKQQKRKPPANKNTENAKADTDNAKGSQKKGTDQK